MENKTIYLERLFNADVKKVWSALTDKNEMKLWYFDLKEFKPEVGFVFQFTGGPSPEKQYLHICEITELIPEKKLTYSWRYDGYSGISYVSFELFPQDNKTLLKLTHKDIGTFPSDNADLSITNFEAGWDSIINTSLKNYLEKDDFHYEITVESTAKKIYTGLTQNIQNWWTEKMEGSANKINEVFTVRFDKTFKKIKVVELIPDKKIIWEVMESYIDIAEINNKSEWNGTKIVWEINQNEDSTDLILTHHGLKPSLECYEVCDNGWISFMESFHDYITTGMGTPFG
jgi:uncharacterized protein YndB with AHSA1/START domain